MALPNPGMDAVPFTPLTAEFLDDMIENIESLSNGTGFEDGAITTNTLAESAVTGLKVASGFSFLGAVTASSGDYTYNNAGGPFEYLTGLTGLNITTTRPNQTILIVLKAQVYSQCGVWKVQDGTTDITASNQVGFGAMSTQAQTVIFIATLASTGNHTLNAMVRAQANGHRIIHGEGQGMLAAIALY